MMEVIGGLLMTGLVLAPTAMLVYLLGIQLLDLHINMITGTTQFPSFNYMFDDMMDNFNKPVQGLLLAGGIATAVLIWIGVLHGFLGKESYGANFVVIMMTPYKVGAFTSVLLIPIFTYVSTILTLKYTYKATQKVMALKKVLTSHINDKGAHS